MGRLLDASEELVKFFDEVRDKTNIPQWIEFLVYINNKQKKDICKLRKFDEASEKASKGINFVVIINEEILNSLPEDMQIMAIDECLAGVSVNENDVISISQPDFKTYTGVLQKYGDDKVIALHESIKSLYDGKKQKEDQEKAETATKKGKRGRKPKF